MRRRAFLAATLGASAGVVATGHAAGHPKDGEGAGTPPAETPSGTGEGPLGSVHVENATEAVVGDDGTTVYVATMDGFAVVDASDPAEPTVVSTVEGILADHEHGPMAAIQDAKVAGDRLLVVGPANPRSVVAAAVLYDVSDPTNPTQIDALETDYPIHNAFLTDEFAYLTGNGAEGNPLVILEVGGDDAGGEQGDGEGDVLTERGRWSLFDEDDAWREVASSLRVVHDVWVQDDRAYLAHWDAGTWIVDVSDPDDPTTVSRVRGRDPEELAAIQENAAVRREAIELPGNDHLVTVNEDATLLGVGLEAWDDGSDGESGDGGGNRGPGGIRLYDVSDETNPVEVGHVDPPPTPDPGRDGVWTTAHNFELAGGHCYSSWYQGGVRVHDVSDPANPIERYAWRDASTTRFWTARRASPGETFVASSMGVDDHGTAVPDAVEGGEATGTPSEDDGSDQPDPGAAGLYVFPDPVEVDAPTSEAPAATSTGTGVTGVMGPGLGAVAALVGAGSLALGARRLRRD